jgi:hypothetical protein
LDAGSEDRHSQFTGARIQGRRRIMNFPAKTNVLQSYQVVLYNKALHPELFPLKGRQVVRHGEYELEAWIMPGAHILRFEYKTLCVSELVTDQDKKVPAAGVVTAFLCAGERDFEHKFVKDKVNYVTMVTTETLSDSLYQSSYQEMVQHARVNRSLAHLWNDEGGKCLSLIDIQHSLGYVHADSYHFVASAGLVLRTQTIFEHK